MQGIIETVLPIFALVLCGYALGRRRWMSEEAIKGLANFVFYLAIPALLFRSLARGLGPVDLTVVLAYFSGVVLSFLLAFAITRAAFRTDYAEQVLAGMGSSFSNTVMLGIPLVLTVFGEAGRVPLMLIITFHSILIIPAVSVLLEIGRGRGKGWGGMARTSLASIFANPVILALLAGTAWGMTGWSLPTPAERFIELLSGAATPCALFALGASLTGFKIAGDLKETMVVVVLKLFAHPAIVAVFAWFVLDLEPGPAAVAIVMAALPAGANVFILAQHYNTYTARSASAILISTGLSVITLSALIALFQGG